MVALVVGADFELAELRRTIAGALPAYARPVFLRIVPTLETTGTFKLRTQELARQGFDPAKVSDALYLDDAARGEYLRLDAPLYERIVSGEQRV
jgi:fatty-acyl-CoA synthase